MIGGLGDEEGGEGLMLLRGIGFLVPLLGDAEDVLVVLRVGFADRVEAIFGQVFAVHVRDGLDRRRSFHVQQQRHFPKIVPFRRDLEHLVLGVDNLTFAFE